MLAVLRRYGWNVGWLIAPVLLWNVALGSSLPRPYLPEVFNRDIPAALATTENTLRIFLFALPFFAPLEWTTRRHKAGFALFAAGLAIYFASWLPLIFAPHSAWSQSAFGFLAPAYTPVFWLAGLSLVMQRLQWPSPYRWWGYLILAVGFLSAHIGHAALVFSRFTGE